MSTLGGRAAPDSLSCPPLCHRPYLSIYPYLSLCISLSLYIYIYMCSPLLAKIYIVLYKIILRTIGRTKSELHKQGHMTTGHRLFCKEFLGFNTMPCRNMLLLVHF